LVLTRPSPASVQSSPKSPFFDACWFLRMWEAVPSRRAACSALDPFLEYRNLSALHHGHWSPRHPLHRPTIKHLALINQPPHQNCVPDQQAARVCAALDIS
jgi:hypothetical protein